MIDDGVVYQIPTMGALWAGCANKTLFEEAGLTPPTPAQGYDFEEWYSWAKTLTKPSEDIQQKIFGTELLGFRFDGYEIPWCGEDGRTAIGNADSEEYINMYTWRARIWQEELCPIGDIGRILGGNAFALGKVAIGQADYAPLLANMEAHGVDATVCMFPKLDKNSDVKMVVGWTDSWAAFKGTKEPDATFSWLIYLTTDGSMTRSLMTHYPPLHRPTMEKMNWTEHNWLGQEVWNLLETHPTWPFHPGVTSAPMNNAWTKITEGGEPVEPTLRAAAQELQRELDKIWEEWDSLKPIA
jgi:ABC-type glycerol-3-phosphate transport system substrate-binding protein